MLLLGTIGRFFTGLHSSRSVLFEIEAVQSTVVDGQHLSLYSANHRHIIDDLRVCSSFETRVTRRLLLSTWH